MNQLIRDLVRDGYLRTERIIEAFSEIRRAEFVPEDLAEQAEADIPLPIGYGQTISQPLTVAFMLELLDPKPGHHILDVGSGSGWTTGLLAHIVGEMGKVTAMEVIGELCDFGKKNVAKFGFIKKGMAEFHCVSAENGFEKNAPYDRILVSAAVEDIPPALKRQLAVGGKMVIPVGGSIRCLRKKGEDDFDTEKFEGFAFVPFVTGRSS